MNTKAIIDEHLIINDEYEQDLITRILKRMSRDIASIYDATKRNSDSEVCRIINSTTQPEEYIEEYVGGFDDSNTGKILLFLSKLPVISRQISQKHEEENMSGIAQIIAREKVDEYTSKLFNAGYKRLYKDMGEDFVAKHLYYECEKFIDALVLEYKQDLTPMINVNNLVYDDIFYLRRTCINLANNNENKSIAECIDCDKDCTYIHCNILNKKVVQENNLHEYKRCIALLDAKLNNQIIPQDQLKRIGRDDLSEMVKKVCLKNFDDAVLSKKILFQCNPKIFSIISAERFDKILKRRYNQKDYEKDKDIYLMLHSGIDFSLFTGDELLKNIAKINEAYTGNGESSK